MIINNTHNLNQLHSDELPISAHFSPTELTIARHIVFYASKSWGYCLKTQQKIADELSVCRKTVSRTIAKLKLFDFAALIRNGRNASKIYIKDKIRELFSVKSSNVPSKSHREPNTINKKKKRDRSDRDKAYGVCVQNKLSEDETLTVMNEVERSIVQGKITNIRAFTQSVVKRVKNGDIKLTKGPQTRQRELAQDIERSRQEQALRRAQIEEMEKNVERGGVSMSSKSLLKKFRSALSGK